MHSEDACIAANNHGRQLQPDDKTLIWERTTDEYGEALLLRGPNTGWSVFRPAQGKCDRQRRLPRLRTPSAA